MNSKQRRHERVFAHEVTLVAGRGANLSDAVENYYAFEQRCDQAKGWLQWQTKRKNYFVGTRQFDHQTFRFRSGALATVFALKWS
jgi:hypothetical protein